MEILEFKVHSPRLGLIAACKFAEDAAMLVAFLGNGTTILHGDRKVWHEGRESQPAGESYDHTAKVIHDRMAL